MVKLAQGDLCPKCGQGKVHRINRRFWMRLLPRSKLYCCEECRARFLTIYTRSIRLPYGPSGEGN